MREPRAAEPLKAEPLKKGARAADDSALRVRAARLASSPYGTALAAGWGFAEALSWPVLPEVALAALCVADPRSGPRLAASAAAGSVAGGAVAYSLARAGVDVPAPLTTDRMRTAVAEQMAAEGPHGVRHQPLAGIPYKLYAARAGRDGLGAAEFAKASARARGTRILTAGLALAAFGAAARGRRRHYPAYLAAVGAGFTGALALIVRGWR
ncbi:hypothetical protein [Nocardiopsis baichengensis]|uniref:hypothetical protein n=1 Tax=Nocardiopsis baichengensis TaxID=280240 RepID=UPI000346C034|nr:hypothetical protein [Nocardiopsis baichengensis]